MAMKQNKWIVCDVSLKDQIIPMVKTLWRLTVWQPFHFL